MVSFKNGDVLIAAGNDQSYFSHHDAQGVFIETIPLGSFTTTSAAVEAFTQYKGSLYALVEDFAESPTDVRIQEYNSAGHWVRDVFYGIDGADPAQNPDEEFQTSLDPTTIAMDSEGNIYLTINNGYRVWKYSNSGAFVDTWLVPEPVAGGRALNNNYVRPGDDCELALISNFTTGTPNTYVSRFNPCTELVTAVEIIPPLGTGNNATGMHYRDGTFYHPSYLPIPTPTFATLYIYDVDWNLQESFVLPTPSSLDPGVQGVRVNKAKTGLWIASDLATSGSLFGIYKLDLASRSVEIGPIPITHTENYNDLLVWRQFSQGVFGTVIGAT